MILENCDHLFGSQPGRFKKFGKNWEMFLFAPNIEICEFMAEQYEDSGSQGFGENVAAWFQEILPKDSNNLLDWIIEEFVLMKFSAKSGRIHIYEYDFSEIQDDFYCLKFINGVFVLSSFVLFFQ